MGILTDKTSALIILNYCSGPVKTYVALVALGTSLATANAFNDFSAGLSLRQVALEAVSPRPNFIGTPEQVADELIRWIDAGASDGFILGFAAQREGLEDFVTQVLPILQAISPTVVRCGAAKSR